MNSQGFVDLGSRPPVGGVDPARRVGGNVQPGQGFAGPQAAHPQAPVALGARTQQMMGPSHNMPRGQGGFALVQGGMPPSRTSGLVSQGLLGQPTVTISDITRDRQTYAEMREDLSCFVIIRLERAAEEDEPDSDSGNKKSTWARVLRTTVPGMSKSRAATRVRHLREARKLSDRLADLTEVQRTQLDTQREELNDMEPDARFEHVLVQIDSQLEVVEDRWNDDARARESSSSLKRFSSARESSSSLRKSSNAKKSSSIHSSSIRRGSSSKKSKYRRISLIAYYKRRPRDGQDLRALLDERDAERLSGLQTQQGHSTVPPSNGILNSQHVTHAQSYGNQFDRPGMTMAGARGDAGFPQPSNGQSHMPSSQFPAQTQGFGQGHNQGVAQGFPRTQGPNQARPQGPGQGPWQPGGQARAPAQTGTQTPTPPRPPLPPLNRGPRFNPNQREGKPVPQLNSHAKPAGPKIQVVPQGAKKPTVYYEDVSSVGSAISEDSEDSEDDSSSGNDTNITRPSIASSSSKGKTKRRKDRQTKDRPDHYGVNAKVVSGGRRMSSHSRDEYANVKRLYSTDVPSRTASVLSSEESERLRVEAFEAGRMAERRDRRDIDTLALARIEALSRPQTSHQPRVFQQSPPPVASMPFPPPPPPPAPPSAPPLPPSGVRIIHPGVNDYVEDDYYVGGMSRLTLDEERSISMDPRRRDARDRYYAPEEPRYRSRPEEDWRYDDRRYDDRRYETREQQIQRTLERERERERAAEEHMRMSEDAYAASGATPFGSRFRGQQSYRR